MRLDIKEAPAIPTEHPQWDISESEDEGNGATANGGADDDELSEFATDDEIEEDDEWKKKQTCWSVQIMVF